MKKENHYRTTRITFPWLIQRSKTFIASSKCIAHLRLLEQDSGSQNSEMFSLKFPKNSQLLLFLPLGPDLSMKEKGASNVVRTRFVTPIIQVLKFQQYIHMLNQPKTAKFGYFYHEVQISH